MEAHVIELRYGYRAEAMGVWAKAQENLSELARTQGLPQSESAPLLGNLSSLQGEIAAAPNIDAAIARKARVAVLESGAAERIVARINELAAQRTQVTVSYTVPGSCAAKPAQPIKQLKTFRPAAIAANRVREHPADVKHYLEALKTALLNELGAGHKVRLE